MILGSLLLVLAPRVVLRTVKAVVPFVVALITTAVAGLVLLVSSVGGSTGP